MNPVERLEHLSHTTAVVIGYYAAAALVALSILSIVQWGEMNKRGVPLGATYYWWQKLIDVSPPLVVTGLSIWTMLNGIRPDWLTLAAASIVLAAHFKYSTQWKEGRA